MNTNTLRLLALGAALCLTACETAQSTPDQDESTEKTSTNQATSEAPAPAEAREGDAEAVAAAQRGFAADVLAQASAAAGADGNVFLSPYSIHAALGMTLAGARGKTAEQIADVLGIAAIPAARRHTAMAAHFGSLSIEEIGVEQGEPFSFAVANRVWTAQGLELLAPFAQTTREQYGAEAAPVNFAASEEARATINGWIARKTMDRIPELIPAGVLSEDTRLVLTNALYFKGSWARAFVAESTKDAAFAAPSGEVSVPMMRAAPARYRYASSGEYEALSLPYIGGADMLVILPRDGKFAQVAEALEGDGLGEVMSDETEPRQAVVSLPKFTFRVPLDLKPALQALGIEDAFVQGAADFSGMYADAKAERAFVSDVLHEAFIAVDEAGTEAAAATAVVVGTRSAPMDRPLAFTVDRPFFFVIRHTATNTPLFVGRVMDPTKE